MEYYKGRSAEWVEHDTTPQYCIKAEEMLHQEAQRVVSYLNSSSEGPLLRVVEAELLATHEARLLDKETHGLRWLLKNKCKEDLARM